ncbi:hypothetical protein FG386_003264 [Cryptosporidium ryanae]|uniref:uncharacterized protein n=1 Tax=Cryptosporidium ryanae TaxID=515981 RepID=UPI00351AACBF|nr:hypothetical protein FG386_003264 [Cryptosporidium ryanae]
MNRLLSYIGVVFISLCVSSFVSITSADSTEVIPAIASSPKESCSLGYSCQTISCRGGSLVGLCSNKIASGYTVRMRGKLPRRINPYITKYMGIAIDQTRLVLRVFDDNRAPYIDIHIGVETVGFTLLGQESSRFDSSSRKYAGITLEREPENFRNSGGDDFDIYLFYRSGYLTMLFKHKNNKYYEAGSLAISNKVLSHIAPITGPVDYDINFEQSMSLSIPSYVSYSFPGGENSKQVYSGPFTVRKGTFVVQPGGDIFEDGIRFVIYQGKLTINGGVTFSFSSNFNPSNIKLKVTIKNINNLRFRLTVNNIFKNKNEVVEVDVSNAKTNSDSDCLRNMSFIISGGNLLFCVGDSCYASFDIRGAEISRIDSTVWFTTVQTFGHLDPVLYGSAIGKHKCKVGDISCSGTEMRLSNPLAPGQQVKIVTNDSGGQMNSKFSSEAQRNVFRSILMGDSNNMRVAAFIATDSISILVFSEGGIVTDSCSVYLSGASRLSQNVGELTLYVGLSNRNKLGVSGLVGGTIKLYCEVSIGSISIKNIRPFLNSHHSNISTFTLTKDYPENGYDSISGGSADSRSLQQTSNCYLSTNGNCNSMKAVHMNGVGFVDETYVLIKSEKISFPFSIYVKSTENNSDQLVFSMISTGKIGIRNLNESNVVVYSIVPPICLERILFDGLTLLLSSDSSKVYASACGYLLGSVSSRGLNKKLTYVFHSNMVGNTIQVTNYPVYSGSLAALDYVSQPYSSTKIVDDELKFHSPCDANNKQTVSCNQASSIINLPNIKLPDGYSIAITGIVEKPTGSFESALNIGVSAENIIQIFSLRADNNRDIYQLFITRTQLGLSIHNPKDISQYLGHFGADIPPNVDLEEGAKYKIGIAFYNKEVNVFIESPYGSGNLLFLRRNIISQVFEWGETPYNVNFRNFEPIRSIVPVLLVKSPYDYSLDTRYSLWGPIRNTYKSAKPGDKSCTLPVFGVCSTPTVYMPGNKPVYQSVIFIFYFYYFNTNTFTLFFKKEDGSVVAEFIFTKKETLWNQTIDIYVRTNLENSKKVFSTGISNNDFRIFYSGQSFGYRVNRTWMNLLLLNENEHFNHITSTHVDGFVSEFIPVSNTNPGLWGLSDNSSYGSAKAKSTKVSAYQKCDKSTPSESKYSSYNVYYPGSAIENLCSTSLHPDNFAITFKSRYPSFTSEEVSKVFSNFPGFLQSFVLTYNGAVVYTLVVARKYIVLFNSINNGNAGSFSSCSSQVPNESEFDQGRNYYITFFVLGGELHVYFHSYSVGKSALLCKIPYTHHFNSARVFGQLNVSDSDTVALAIYDLKRTLYNPTLSANNIYPMGTVRSKNVIISSGAPFSPGESLSVELECGKDVIFAGQTGKTQLQLVTNGDSFTINNVPGKIVAEGKLTGDCICSSGKRIVVNLAYVSNQFRLIACGASAASILTNGASIYQISSEAEIQVIYRTDLRLAVATSLTTSQISRVEEQPDTSRDEQLNVSKHYLPESFEIPAIMHVIPSYKN